MPLLLALDASLARVSAGVIRDATVLAERIRAAPRGESVPLAPLAADVLRAAGVTATSLDAVAVTVGPGSFTGLRAALALAHGVALAIGRPVIGVTLAEVFAAELLDAGSRVPGTRLLRTAIDSRRGRVFVADGGEPFRSCALDALPLVAGPVAVAGDAAVRVAARLAARGDDVRLTDARLPRPWAVGMAASRRLEAKGPHLATLPLYVDPPEASLPRGGLRPAPIG